MTTHKDLRGGAVLTKTPSPTVVAFCGATHATQNRYGIVTVFFTNGTTGTCHSGRDITDVGFFELCDKAKK